MISCLDLATRRGGLACGIEQRDLAHDVRQVYHARNDGKLGHVLVREWAVVVLVQTWWVGPATRDARLHLEREQAPAARVNESVVMGARLPEEPYHYVLDNS